MKEKLIVISLNEISDRWQIPVERICHLIVECGLDPAEADKWVSENWDLWMTEKQKAFEESVFPRPLRPEPTETAS